MWLFEHGHNPHMHTFTDALYWSFITATTVGYGDTSPVTTGGRIVSGLLVFLGLGLLGFASSRLTAYWLPQDDGDEVVKEITRVREELAEVKAALRDIAGRLD